jgi:hypothetical protein
MGTSRHKISERARRTTNRRMIPSLRQAGRIDDPSENRPLTVKGLMSLFYGWQRSVTILTFLRVGVKPVEDLRFALSKHDLRGFRNLAGLVSQLSV